MSTITHAQVAAAKAGDADASTYIFRAMEPVLGKLARKYCGEYHTDDGVATGQMAVWEAVLSFDPERGTQFITHAFYMARVALMDFVSQNNPGPSVPVRTAKRYSVIMDAAAGDLDEALRLVRGTADVTEHGTAETFLAAHAALTDPKHIDRTRESDEGDAESEVSADGALTVGSHEDAALDSVVVEQLLATCTEDEVLILSTTFGLPGFPFATDAEMAAQLGTSRVSVVRTRARALNRLAHHNPHLEGEV